MNCNFPAGGAKRCLELFLSYHAPVAEDHARAFPVAFLLPVGVDAHCPERLAHLAGRTADTNDAVYCPRYPDLAQFALTVSGLIVPIALLLPSIPS